jgi:hypothetical protein
MIIKKKKRKKKTNKNNKYSKDERLMCLKSVGRKTSNEITLFYFFRFSKNELNTF